MGEEHRLRLALLPLEVHVEQDCLEFFQRFVELSQEVIVTPENAVDPSTVMFFQTVEVAPLEVKVLCGDAHRLWEPHHAISHRLIILQKE
jgi:hypothetical protein